MDGPCKDSGLHPGPYAGAEKAKVTGNTKEHVKGRVEEAAGKVPKESGKRERSGHPQPVTSETCTYRYRFMPTVHAGVGIRRGHVALLNLSSGPQLRPPVCSHAATATALDMITSHASLSPREPPARR